MNQLSPEARRLLKLARQGDRPDAAVQRRVERSLVRRLALGTAVAAGGALITKSAAGARVLMLAAKIVGVGGAVVGTGWLASHALNSPQPSDAPLQAPVAQKPQSPSKTLAAAEEKSEVLPEIALPAEEAVAKQPPRTASAPKKAALEAAPSEPAPVAEFPPLPSAAPDRLLAETNDLRRAQQALRAGDPALALKLVREQEQRHAGGVLQQERAAVSVFALCESGQVASARAEALKFEQRWPESALVARVKASCRDR